MTPDEPPRPHPNEDETASIVDRFDHDPAAERPRFSPGELLLDRFRIVRAVGRGGMGDVYEATDLQLGRVALKTIRAAFADHPHMLRRFTQEVRLARKITSPHVCRIHELYVLPPADERREPVVFLSMEFLDGVTLARHIERQGPLPLSEAQPVAIQLCAALDAVHAAGVIHRDFKTNNVMLVAGNGPPHAVLMDLGLALEAIEEPDARSVLTMPGTVTGTSEYMAPEQFEGRSLTPAADIYALGVALYEMVTGARPFRAASPIAAAVRRARHLPPASSIRPGLPPHWDVVIARCLEYDPEKRYRSAGEVAAALLDPSPSAPIPARSPRLRLALLLSILALAAAAAWIWYRSRGNPPPPPDAQRWYERGVAALREATYLQATRALSRAVALDDSFVLAHARLADAWAELDFTAKAQNEMLRASGLDTARRLPKIDKQYLDAVRATITGQFPAAVDGYAAILHALPANEKAYGWVDLGRANEKAGNISEAQKDYAQAAKLSPEDPAPFMRIGILESRGGGRNAEGEAAFARAEALYRAASNAEGIAELAYQRGIAARLLGQAPQARTFLEESLHAAHELDSPQLQIRALTQLSIVEYSVDNTVKAIELANTALDLARERGLDSWATEGQIRAGTFYIDQHDLVKAEASIQRGLRQAEELRNPRLEALARLSFASLRDQQSGPPEERIALARQALDYYKTTRFFVQTTTALTLLVRARTDNADFQQALADSNELLEAARKSTNPTHIVQAEESAGGVLIKLERYPEALTHFQSALTTARGIGVFVGYEASNYAYVLWHLGRYREATAAIDSIPADKRKAPDMAALIDRVYAGMALSQRRFKEALDLTQHALKHTASSTPSEYIELEMIAGFAQAELGAHDQARQSCQGALDTARKRGDRFLSAEAGLCLARADIASGSPRDAIPLAESSRQFFSNSQQHESEWRSLLYLAEACNRTGDPASAAQHARKALDILSGLENNSYASRPDVQLARQELCRTGLPACPQF